MIERELIYGDKKLVLQGTALISKHEGLVSYDTFIFRVQSSMHEAAKDRLVGPTVRRALLYKGRTAACFSAVGLGALLLSACLSEPTPTASQAEAAAPRAPTAAQEPIPSPLRYNDPYLGFAVEYPLGWEVMALSAQDQQSFPPARPRATVRFVSNLYAGGHQAFGRYMVTVAVGEASWGRTVTETVEYYLAVVVPTVAKHIQSRGVFELGGEPAIELTGLPQANGKARQTVVMHEGAEYWLAFSPDAGLNTPSDVAARAAFDAFLRSFTFIPITVAPTPTITPVPTPGPQTLKAQHLIVAGLG